MVFATPRSWVRVSDILHYDSDVTNPVIRYKIIGNVGEVEGNQFVEYCKKQATVVTADDFILGKAQAPKSPEEVSILVSSIVNKATVLKGIGNTVENDEQKYLVERLVRALFRLPQAEYTIIGLKGLLDINREAVKSVFFQMDEKSIQHFIEKNGYALGLEEPKQKNGLFWKG